MKYLSAIAIVILLLCGGAMWFLASGSLNDFIKQQIESQGSAITKQTVNVNNVDIRFSQAAGTIEQLTISNVVGFPSPFLYQLAHITLDINMNSLKDTPIIIDTIKVDGSLLNVDINSEGVSNIQILKEQLALPAPQSPDQTVETDSTKDPQIKISQLILTNITAQLDGTALGGEKYEVTLPKIAIANVGGDGGVPASQLGKAVMQQVINAIWQETKKIQKDKLKNKLKDKLKDNVSDKLKSLIQ